jgi:hypothetical protein
MRCDGVAAALWLLLTTLQRACINYLFLRAQMTTSRAHYIPRFRNTIIRCLLPQSFAMTLVCRPGVAGPILSCRLTCLLGFLLDKSSFHSTEVTRVNPWCFSQAHRPSFLPRTDVLKMNDAAGVWLRPAMPQHSSRVYTRGVT